MAGTGLPGGVATVTNTPVKALTAGLIANALVICLVAIVFAAQLADSRGEVNLLRSRVVTVEAERDDLRARVAALEAALIAAGVDPQTIVVPDEPEPPTEDQPQGAAPTRAPMRSDSPQRTAKSEPQPAPQPAPAPAPQPDSTPPPDEPEPDAPGPLPNEVCGLLPVCG